MTLPRALLCSLLVHVALVATAGTTLRSSFQGQSPAPEPAREPTLHFNLVDPAFAELDADDAPAPGEVPENAVSSGARSAAGPADGARATSPPSASAAPASEPASADDAPPAGEEGRPRTVATSADKGVAPASVAPGLLPPRELAGRIGLDIEGLDDEVVRGMFSAMHAYALQAPRPAASTYRQLLRAWIDGLMGYPYPVLEDLSRNRSRRFIGGIRVEVDADGRVRLAELWVYPDVADPDGRLAAYYERVIRTATAHAFLSPGDAGLPAPHGLEYRIVNPTASR